MNRHIRLPVSAITTRLRNSTGLRLRLAGMALLLFAFSAAAHAQTSGTTPDGFVWVSTSGTTTITAYTGTNSVVVITGTINVSGSNLQVNVIGDGVMGDGMFGIFKTTGGPTSVTIPDGVSTIAVNAFGGCRSLTSVTIPESVTSIGVQAFFACSGLTSISVSEQNSAYCSVGGVLFSSGTASLIAYPESIVGSYKIPGSVTSIGDYAFAACTGLTSVTIPDSVTSIGDGAFSSTGLTSVTIPDSVTSIGNQAFEQCSNLTSVSLAEGLTSIGDFAFYRCSKLTSLTIPESVISIGQVPFYGCSSLTSITVSAQNSAYCSVSGVLFDSGTATLLAYPCGKAGSYAIPSSVTSIGFSAFNGSGVLTSVTIPDSVTTIGDQAFSTCTSLASVSIGNGVTSIGDSTFDDTRLTSVTIPKSVTSIKDSAFLGCSSLKSAVFLGDAPTMGSFVFLIDASDFTVYYYNGAKNFASPTWTDSFGDKYPAVDLGNIPSSTSPQVTTTGATAVTASSATLGGAANPEKSDTLVYFQYGTTNAYGMSSGTSDIGSGSAKLSFSEPVSGLAPKTLYHYRAVATSGTTVYGADKTFTTLAAPVFPTVPVAYLGALDTELSQSVNPQGVKTSVYYQYGTTPGYGSQSATQSIGGGKAALGVFGLLAGLDPSQLYYYQMVTVSASGTFYGTSGTFTTLAFDTALVAQKGGTAAGLGGATFDALGSPAVNAGDNVAFLATLTTGTHGVTKTNDTGIWAENESGSLQLVALTGSAAPGTSGTFVTLSDPAYSNNEAVAFRGTLKVATGEATSSTAAGVWSSSSGTLALLARQGSAAPETAGTFGAFTSLGLSDSGGAIVFATLNNDAAAHISAANNAGIWKGSTAADLALLLRLSGTVGGKTISKLSFLPLETVVNGQTRSFNPVTGDIVCGATFSDKTTGIVTVLSGSAQIAALSGGTAAGIGGATFAAFGSPAINAGNHIAFEATLTVGAGGVTKNNGIGIWAQDGTGALKLIAQTGTSAPGTAANFLGFSDPVYNGNEAVAFRGTLKVATGQATSATAEGVWVSDGTPGSLVLVARQGGHAPGCPTEATFAAFTELALADQGGVTNKGGAILLATLNASTVAGVTKATDTGIWAVDTSGNLQLIARTGDLLGGKTITALSFLPALTYVNGQSRSFAQETGDLAYLATFSDKSTAIISVVFP